MCWVTTWTVSFARSIKSLNQASSKNPPGAIINGFTLELLYTSFTRFWRVLKSDTYCRAVRLVPIPLPESSLPNMPVKVKIRKKDDSLHQLDQGYFHDFSYNIEVKSLVDCQQQTITKSCHFLIFGSKSEELTLSLSKFDIWSYTVRSVFYLNQFWLTLSHIQWMSKTYSILNM